MANKYGVQGELGPTILTTPQSLDNVPVYVGIAPLHLAAEPAPVNRPVLITSYDDGVRKLGYADDIEKYDLCMAMSAHFKNRIKPVGPIVCINVYDPAASGATASEDTSVSVTLRGGVGYIDDQDCVIGSITGIPQDANVHIRYDGDIRKIKITDMGGTVASPLALTYKKAVVSGIDADDIVGATTDAGVKTGVQAIHYTYQTLGVVPAFLCAPKFGGDVGVHAALTTASQAVSGRFFAVVPSDIASDTNKDVPAAITGKNAAGLTGEMDLPSWPIGKKDGAKYYGSVLRTVALMQTDAANGGIPMETADNTELDIDGVCLADGTDILLDIDLADKIKAAGIATMLRWGGKWRLWGCHTGAYADDAQNVDKRAIFDSGIRMLYYVLNTFTQRYFDDIRKPMTRNRLDAILVDVNKWLDGLVTRGALLYAAAEADLEGQSDDDLVNGRIKFKLRATSTPPLSLITAVLSYTDEGLARLVA